MILVDTSVWVDHLRSGEDALSRLLDHGRVLSHPFIIGELALGQMRQRELILTALAALPRAIVATDAEVFGFIARCELFGRGIGYVDVHLLAAASLSSAASLWTRDKRLHRVAVELGVTRTPPFTEEMPS
ncbi:MAG: type II toxin-antitoxin system VapC family toxin [Rhizomicrobium sp.]